MDLKPEQIQALRRGEDIEYGGVNMAHRTLMEQLIRPVSYAYCSDTRYDQRLLNWIKGVSVLYHETTFMNDMVDMAIQTGHSTSGEAGRMADAAKVSCLITGHYSSRYKDLNKLIAEAGQNFDHVLEAVEGRKYNLRNLALGMEV